MEIKQEFIVVRSKHGEPFTHTIYRRMSSPQQAGPGIREAVCECYSKEHADAIVNAMDKIYGWSYNANS